MSQELMVDVDTLRTQARENHGTAMSPPVPTVRTASTPAVHWLFASATKRGSSRVSQTVQPSRSPVSQSLLTARSPSG